LPSPAQHAFGGQLPATPPKCLPSRSSFAAASHPSEAKRHNSSSRFIEDSIDRTSRFTNHSVNNGRPAHRLFCYGVELMTASSRFVHASAWGYAKFIGAGQIKARATMDAPSWFSEFVDLGRFSSASWRNSCSLWHRLRNLAGAGKDGRTNPLPPKHEAGVASPRAKPDTVTPCRSF